jgi:hypothetical protein
VPPSPSPPSPPYTCPQVPVIYIYSLVCDSQYS